MEASINEAEKSELVVFPETALIQTQEELKNWISNFDKKAKDKGVLFITGIIARNEEEIADNKMRNRILGLGAAEGYYDKKKLVPFGEFVPLESYIGNLLDFMGLNLTNTVPGNEYSLIKSKDLLLAPSICYEIAFSGIINETAKNANILVTISNDTWFGDSLGPIQHLEIAQDRALEQQKPVIRSTNSGISAIIDNKGIIKTKLGHFEGDRISSIVTSYQGRTPFTYIGNFLSYFYVLIILGICIIKRTKVL
jgi:apolipoprotein N-acyltransferase